MLPAPAMNPSKHQLSGYGWRPADPPRRPVLFINPRSGDGKAARAGVAAAGAPRGSRPSSSPRAWTWPRWPMKPRRPAQTRSGWPAATGRWRSWRLRRPRTGSRSCAFRPARATNLPKEEWLQLPMQWRESTGRSLAPANRDCYQTGLLTLVCADVVRPAMRWMVRRASRARWVSPSRPGRARSPGRSCSAMPRRWRAGPRPPGPGRGLAVRGGSGPSRPLQTIMNC